MNIKDAKIQIQNAMVAYFSKDKHGNICIPIERQRPIFLMGPPGIGKTAIMEQIASELGVGLVSYSMTHHTRQSALGLPFIVKKNYQGTEYDVSKYTMSEIIASVYDMIEDTGYSEGILFLDEINCVSETLAPSMLQFLQYKTFGQHRIPNGWIVVTAGNPPEYNNSVRDFDIVTWDRLKRIDVTPDYDVWKEFSYKKGIHPAIITYLDIKKENFYKIESTVNGKLFVTARGWSDLSEMMMLYENNGIEIDERLISQYLQNPKIAKDFAIYLDLYNKYKSDYQIPLVLEGKATPEIKARAHQAKFDERLSVLGMLLDAVSTGFRESYAEEEALLDLAESIKKIKKGLSNPTIKFIDVLEREIADKRKQFASGKRSMAFSDEKQGVFLDNIEFLREQFEILKDENLSQKDGISALKVVYDERVKKLRSKAATDSKRLSHVFKFCEEVFGEGQEILILVTELTANYYCAHHIGKYGCKEYFDHNKELLFYERTKEIITSIDLLDFNIED